MGADTKRKRKNKLWIKQLGMCCWCNEQMINHVTWAKEQASIIASGGTAEKIPPMLATLEHIHDRLDPVRKTREGKINLALACHACNHKRAIETTRRANAIRRAKVKQGWLAELDRLQVFFEQKTTSLIDSLPYPK